MAPIAHAPHNLHAHPRILPLGVLRLGLLVVGGVPEPALLIAVARRVPGLAVGVACAYVRRSVNDK